MSNKRISLDLIEDCLADVPTREDNTDSEAKYPDNFALRELMNDNLTKKQKCYIIMYYRDGLTMEEIAKRSGVARSTVSRTIFRGRERLLTGAKRQALRKILG